MLDQDTFKAGLAMLTTAFPNIRVNSENLKIWYNFFKDLEDENFMFGIDLIVKTSKKTPMIAEIREAAINTTFSKLTADDAWELVIKAIRSGDLTTDKDFGDERLNRVVSIYYSDLREMTSENRSIVRAQFMKTFSNFQERENQVELSGNSKLKALLNRVLQPSLGGKK